MGAAISVIRGYHEIPELHVEKSRKLVPSHQGNDRSDFVNNSKDLLYQILSLFYGKRRFTFGDGACRVIGAPSGIPGERGLKEICGIIASCLRNPR